MGPSFATTIGVPRVEVLPDERLRFQIHLRVENPGAFIIKDYLSNLTDWERVSRSSSHLAFRKTMDDIEYLVQIELRKIAGGDDIAYRVDASMETTAPVTRS